MEIAGRRISRTGLEKIRQWEGCKLDAYLDSGGVPTIGVGHTKGVTLGMTITEEQADEWLQRDLAEAEDAVDQLVHVPLTDNEYAALVSFVFNVGRQAFWTSTLLQVLNRGDYGAVPKQLARWNKDNGRIVPGLVNRRAAEAALWSS